MKSVYIDCSPFMNELLSSELRALLPELVVHVGDPNQEKLLELLDDATGVLNGHTHMDHAMLARFPKLKSIVYLGTGASNYIDLPAATQLGIQVRLVRNYGDRTIAEHAFALALSAARKICLMDRRLRRGVWDVQSGAELEGKILGVVGTGGIGSALVKMAHGFGMSVLAWNRSGVPPELPCRAVDLDALLRQSDIVSIHVSLTPDTKNLIDKHRLGLLKPTTILVNTSRGMVIDQDAMIDALKRETFAHAAIDVFAEEPLPADHPITCLDNVTLTAHAAFKTPEASRRLLERGIALLRSDLDAIKISEPE